MSNKFLRILHWSVLYVAILPSFSASQTVVIPDSAKVQRRVARNLILAGSGLYTAGMAGLYMVWYKGSEATSFHFFNDLPQWNQMDKAGHGYSAYQLSHLTWQAMEGSGVFSPKTSLWVGGTMGFWLLLPIELFDGFSPDYGASVSDLAANALGSLLFISQHYAWKEQRIQPKFSFNRSGLAHRNPDLLGGNLPEELLKDYNGQSYWLSVSPWAWSRAERAPRWAALAVGYAAGGMVRARDTENHLAGSASYRRFLLSPDVQFSKIRTKKKALKTLFFALDMVKLPAPAIEIRQGRGVRWHWLFPF